MTDKPTQALCQLCGEPMPEGEEMFHYHGHSGPCPVTKLSEDLKKTGAIARGEEPIADVEAETSAEDAEVQAFLDRTKMQTIDGGFPLRFLLRKDGKRILQQMSTIVTYDSNNVPVAQEQLWEDIPEVSEAELEAAN